jgi:uncharacterized protein YeaO (DUF488 family)
MTIRIVQLGSDREVDEGLRIGTVRRPPRGVPKVEYSSKNIYDLWFPNLSPSEKLLKQYSRSPKKNNGVPSSVDFLLK